MKYITTSWDDGHPLDFRIGELLHKYNLNGTFYIPQSNIEHIVMTEDEILELSKSFEIGGHTISHKPILSKSVDVFETEILGCRTWIKNITGNTPNSFCFPLGKYNQAAIDYSKSIGFKTLRSTELLNTNITGNDNLNPTTIQLYPHSTFTYIKHLCKRGNIQSLATYFKLGAHYNLHQLVDAYIQHIIDKGGCFHLWGHSWEIDQFNLWSTLEQVFKQISGIKEIQYLNNNNVTLLNAAK